MRRLTLLRNFAIAGLILVILAVDRGFAIPVPLVALTAVTIFLVLFNLGTFWRLQRSWPARELEVVGQIVVDIGALALLLYWSGGATNPLTVLLLAPLAIVAASNLPRRYTWLAASLVTACYVLLFFFHVSLPGPHQSGLDPQAPLVRGMWANYAVSAALIAYLVAGLSRLLHRRERRGLTGSRQEDNGNDYLVHMGALAAGAAHELRSPLTTMALLVDELREQDDRGDRAQNLRIVSDQIQACRAILGALTSYGQDALVNDKRIEPVDSFLDETVAKWRSLRPGVQLELLSAGTQAAPRISTDPGLGQAILILLNNAADASPQAVQMDWRCDSGKLRILIQDRGPGIPSEIAGMLGKPFFTTKHDRGTGIGLVLARMAVERARGSLNLSNRPGGGARAEVILPLEARPREQPGPGRDAPIARKFLHMLGG